MTVAHTQLVDPDDIGRFAQLGIVANFEPFWAKYDEWQVELTAPRLGPEQPDRGGLADPPGRSGQRAGELFEPSGPQG